MIRWSAIVCAGLAMAGPARAIDVPVQASTCSDRIDADRPDRDGRRRSPLEGRDQDCGGGGGGPEGTTAYPGVRLVAPAGGGGGGGGGGGSSRTTTAAAPISATAAAGAGSDTAGVVLGPATNQSPSTGGGRVRPAAAASDGPAAAQPAPAAFVLSSPSNQGLFDFGGSGSASAGSDHSAPLPAPGGPLAWLLAVATGALLLWRRRLRG